MNLPEPIDTSFPNWAREFPRPALSPAARARSLRAARSALPIAPRRWLPGFHTSALAACWIAILCLKWINPSYPQRADDGVSSIAYRPPMDAATATLFASVYLHRTPGIMNWPLSYNF